MSALPLRWKIGSLVFLGLLALVVLFGALGSAIAQDAKQRTVAGWANIATSTASVIDSELDLQFERLEQVAAMLGSASREPATQRLVLEGTIGGMGPLVGHTVLVSPDRSVAWPAGPSALADAVAADPRIVEPLRTGGRYASGVKRVEGRALVVLAVPVSSQGVRTAVLALVFSPAEGVIGDLVASARGLAHTGHAELVDQSDHVIVASDAGETPRLGEHPDFYDPHLAAHTSGVGLTEPVGPADPADEGQRHDMAFVSLRHVPWGLALGGSDAELSADSARWEQQTIALGGAAMLVALLLVWITTRSVSRPVLALAAASRQIAAGDLATPVPQGGEGEVRVLAEAFDDMREKLRSALSELAVEKSRYEGIVTFMADAVVTCGADGRITAFNPAASALTGWSSAEAIGRPCTAVISGEPAPPRDARLDPATERIALRRRDGGTATVAVTRSALSGRDGARAGTVHVLRDVSAETEVDRMKEEFLATVSHELRTPLGFIMGYATSLLLPDAPDDRATTRRFLHVIADSSKELEQLVDDLLDMTKIGSGTLSVSPRPTRLGPLVRAAVDRVRGPEHRVVRSVPTALPPILADPRRVEQVLHDLLDNAVKYSPDGGTVTVTAARSGDEVTVSVVDEGLGIRPDELASVFERFHRGRIARSRGIAGTGLGLAICKGIVEAHGGRIWAESPPADAPPGDLRGSAIRFTLPLATSGTRRTVTERDLSPTGAGA